MGPVAMKFHPHLTLYLLLDLLCHRPHCECPESHTHEVVCNNHMWTSILTRSGGGGVSPSRLE